jgi:hypothetical protein
MQDITSSNPVKYLQEKKVLQIYKNRLSQWPYACDDLGPIGRVKKEDGLELSYLQPNQKYNINWLVVDCDEPDACGLWIDKPVPAPNIIIGNKDNGHAHLFWGIATRINIAEGKNKKAWTYYNAIQRAYNVELGGDWAFTGLIAKNPLSARWWVNIPSDNLYTLSDLCAHIELNNKKYNKPKRQVTGEGRNVETFEHTRLTMYREVYRAGYSWPLEVCIARAIMVAEEHNFNTYLYAMSHKECEYIGRSVGKYVFNHQSPEGRSAWARYKGAKGNATIKKNAVDRAEKIREYARNNPAATNLQIALALNVHRNTVTKALKEGSERGKRRF